jgi:hypothetical protein
VIINRGALVLCMICSLLTFPQAANARLLTDVRTSLNGDSTLITFAATAPMTYGVRRMDERTLLVELPGVDATRLASSYTPASPLVAGLTVQCATKDDGTPLTRLRIALRTSVRDRSFLEANKLVLELWPEQSAAQQSGSRQLTLRPLTSRRRQVARPRRPRSAPRRRREARASNLHNPHRDSSTASTVSSANRSTSMWSTQTFATSSTTLPNSTASISSSTLRSAQCP